jgi:hypothetical protein
VLKGRVYPNDLWGLIGERIIEAKQEETLQRHHSVCTQTDIRMHAAVERILLEERKKRCQMEVTLYSQAIEFFEQHWLCEYFFSARMCGLTFLVVVAGLSAQARHTFDLIKPPVKQTHGPAGCVPLPCAPLACLIETRERDAQMRDDVPLIKITVPSLLNSLMPSISSHSASQAEKPTSNNMDVSTMAVCLPFVLI